MTAAARTTWSRANAGYDDEFKRQIAAEIVTAIAKASICTDANVMAIRTAETLEALITVLIATASLTPHFDVPSNLRQFAKDLAKRVRREVAKHRAEGFCKDFIFGARPGGTA